jgi:selenocysteine lyase/cysteine desulfurase
MISFPLPKGINEDIKLILLKDYKIEIPIFKWKNKTFIRSSVQVYNKKKDIDYLISALKTICYI